MSSSASILLDLLDLEPLEVNIYRGRNRDLGSGRVFGGQVFAQALVAARRTVEGAREAHSVHGYFILPGDLEAPINPLRSGGSRQAPPPIVVKPQSPALPPAYMAAVTAATRKPRSQAGEWEEF